MNHRILWIGFIAAFASVVAGYWESHIGYGVMLGELLLVIVFSVEYLAEELRRLPEEVDNNYTSIPPGEYNAEILKADLSGRITKLRITDGKYKGRVIG